MRKIKTLRAMRIDRQHVPAETTLEVSDKLAALLVGTDRATFVGEPKPSKPKRETATAKPPPETTAKE